MQEFHLVEAVQLVSVDVLKFLILFVEEMDSLTLMLALHDVQELQLLVTDNVLVYKIEFLKNKFFYTNSMHLPVVSSEQMH